MIFDSQVMFQHRGPIRIVISGFIVTMCRLGQLFNKVPLFLILTCCYHVVLSTFRECSYFKRCILTIN